MAGISASQRMLMGKKRRLPTLSLWTLMQSIPEPRMLDSKSWSTLRTRITAAAGSAVVIRKAIFGTWEPTTHGHPLPRRNFHDQRGQTCLELDKTTKAKEN